MTNEARDLWDQEAAAFDQEPDHGLHDPATHNAWQQLLLPIVGDQELEIADLGCGTGTLTDPLLWGGPITDERYLMISGPHS